MFFTYHRRSKPTGELLAKVLQMPHGRIEGFSTGIDGFQPTNNDEIIDNRNALIRWGSRVTPEADSAFERVINSVEAINLCSNKYDSLMTMDECELPIPAFSRDARELVEKVGYPILGRKNRHARGEDIELILQERDIRLSKSDFFTQYIPTNREFRVHVVGSKVIRVQAKYLDNPELKKPWIRNYSTGYRFRKPRLRLNQDRLDAAVGAVKCLGLDFGAVDLLIAEDRSCCVLEANTAPSCSPLTLGAYAVALHELAELDTEIDLSYLDMLDPDLEEMDSEDESDEDF